MLKLRQDQQLLHDVSKNWNNELDEIREHITEASIPQETPDHSTTQQTKQTNIIQILTNNIAHLEARIKTLENNEKIQNKRMEQIIIRMDTSPTPTTSHQPTGIDSTNLDIPAKVKTIIKPPTHQDITDDGFIKVGKNKRKYAPTLGISPGEGPTPNPDLIPPLNYANVVLSRAHPPKPVKLPDNISVSPINKITEDNEDNNSDTLDEDQITELRQKIYEANLITGLRPITQRMIDKEEQIVLQECNDRLKNNKAALRQTAVKNAIIRFLKEKLKMSQKDRDELNIQKNFPAKRTDSNIYYVQSKYTDDISSITSHVVNLPQTNFDSQGPQIVAYIPNIMYARYQYCQKMLFKLRMSQPQMLQTNIRLGKIDFLCRYKNKGDRTPWKEVPILTIPDDAPMPEMQLLKDNNNLNTTTPDIEPYNNHITNDNTPPTTNNTDFINKIIPQNNQTNYQSPQSNLSESMGSVSNLLAKHNMSHSLEPTLTKKVRQQSPEHPMEQTTSQSSQSSPSYSPPSTPNSQSDPLALTNKSTSTQKLSSA